MSRVPLTKTRCRITLNTIPRASSICECSVAFALPLPTPSPSASLSLDRDSNGTLPCAGRSCSECSLSTEPSPSSVSSPRASTIECPPAFRCTELPHVEASRARLLSYCTEGSARRFYEPAGSPRCPSRSSRSRCPSSAARCPTPPAGSPVANFSPPASSTRSPVSNRTRLFGSTATPSSKLLFPSPVCCELQREEKFRFTRYRHLHEIYTIIYHVIKINIIALLRFLGRLFIINNLHLFNKL